MTNEQNQNETNTQQTAENITAEARDVKQKISNLVTDIFKAGTDSAGKIPEKASQIIEGAKSGINKVAEDKQAEVLTQVIEGLTDGFSRGAQALKLTVQEAAGNGTTYAQDELKSALDDFKTLESLLTERTEQLLKSTYKTSTQQAGNIFTHTKRTLASVRTDIEQAVRAAGKHPVTLTKESASVAAGVTRLAAGSLLQAIGKAVESTGKIISPDTPEETSKETSNE